MTQGYEESEDKLSPVEIGLPMWIALYVLGVAILISVMAITFADNTSLDFGRYIVDGITWFVIGIYFYFLHIRLKFHAHNRMNLKIISYLAALASIAKFATSIFYTIDRFGQNIWIDAYYCTKLLIWPILAIFFVLYAKRMRYYDVRRSDEDDD